MNKLLIVFLVVLVVFISGCVYQASKPSQPPAEANKVNIQGFAFNPSTITVKKGTTITWTNLDSAAHTVTSSGNFDSGSLSKGQSWSFTFNTAGIFDYTCTFHPNMKGKVIVTE